MGLAIAKPIQVIKQEFVGFSEATEPQLSDRQWATTTLGLAIPAMPLVFLQSFPNQCLAVHFLLAACCYRTHLCPYLSN
jgi:hypothetical protein